MFRTAELSALSAECEKCGKIVPHSFRCCPDDADDIKVKRLMNPEYQPRFPTVMYFCSKCRGWLGFDCV